MQQKIEPKVTKLRQATGSTLRALCIIAQQLGLATTIDQLERTFSLSGSEPPTRHLVGIAKELGLEARQVSVRWRDLPEIAKTLPAILRLTDGSSLILQAVRQDKTTGTVAVVRDPTASGEASVIVDEARLRAVWKGELVLVKRRFDATDERQPFGMSWLMGQVLRERRIFVDIGVAAIVSTIIRHRAGIHDDDYH